MSDKDFEEMERKANEYFAELERREKELKEAYNSGVQAGIKQMEDKMLSASQKGNPIELSDGNVVFVQSDIDHLHSIFSDLERGGN